MSQLMRDYVKRNTEQAELRDLRERQRRFSWAFFWVWLALLGLGTYAYLALTP